MLVFGNMWAFLCVRLSWWERRGVSPTKGAGLPELASAIPVARTDAALFEPAQKVLAARDCLGCASL